jgi:hypothetical protein
MTDSQIMEKYHLSSRGLKSLFRKLLDSQAITPFEYTEWAGLFGRSVDLNDVRIFNRETLDFRMPVHEAGNLKNKGQILNLSETGLGVWGIPTEVGQAKTLIIPVTGAPVAVMARCHWKKEDRERGESVAGFEIANVLHGNWENLVQRIQKLIQKRRGQPARSIESAPTNDPDRFEAAHDEPRPKTQYAMTPESTPRAPVGDFQGTETKPPDIPTRSHERADDRTMTEQPSLEFMEQCLDSDNYFILFTTSLRHLAFIMNPMSFAELTPETRKELLGKVKEKNTNMVSDLRRKAKAFEQAIVNSALLADTIIRQQFGYANERR